MSSSAHEAEVENAHENSEVGLDEELVSVPPFLTKLFEILSKDDFRRYISWGSGGRSVRVSDPAGFQSKVLPSYWRHNNLRSFIRQLNMYGFQRSCDDVAHGRLEFFHDYFVQGRRDLLPSIQRGRQSRKRGLENDSDPLLSSASLPSGITTSEPSDIIALAAQLRRVEAHVMGQLAVLNSKIDNVIHALNIPMVVPAMPMHGQPWNAQQQLAVLFTFSPEDLGSNADLLIERSVMPHHGGWVLQPSAMHPYNSRGGATSSTLPTTVVPCGQPSSCNFSAPGGMLQPGTHETHRVAYGVPHPQTSTAPLTKPSASIVQPMLAQNRQVQLFSENFGERDAALATGSRMLDLSSASLPQPEQEYSRLEIAQSSHQLPMMAGGLDGKETNTCDNQRAGCVVAQRMSQQPFVGVSEDLWTNSAPSTARQPSSSNRDFSNFVRN
mmetsp:Transcript_17355/g.41531  ORF Transcript_17355/g.41531 Transcript_17355/m.41531 type:complete len:439 (-) Transcript_17355:256-1572(-)